MGRQEGGQSPFSFPSSLDPLPYFQLMWHDIVGRKNRKGFCPPFSCLPLFKRPLLKRRLHKDDYTSDHCSKGSWLAKIHCALFCARNPVYACVRGSGPDRAATFREFFRDLCRHTRTIQNKHAPLSLSLEYLSDQITRPAYQ